MEREKENGQSAGDIHTARGVIYTFGYKCFSSQPNAAFYGLISNILPRLKEIAASSEKDDMNGAVETLERFIDKKAALKGKEADEFELDIQRKYAYLMCLPSSAAQEESRYVSKDGLLNQKPHDDMIKLFNKYDIHLSDNKYYYDHVSVELAFMGRLAYLSVDIPENSSEYESLIKEQLDFHREHFDKWIYEYFERIKRVNIDDEILFKPISQFMSGFIREDKLFLENLHV